MAAQRCRDTLEADTRRGVSVLGAGKAQHVGSFKGMGLFFLWFKETACPCYCEYFHEKMESFEFSDFWNHQWFHTKWTDCCFSAELSVQRDLVLEV